jgi:hypothetical protein
MSTIRPFLLAVVAALIPAPVSAQSLPDAARVDMETQTIDFGFAPPIGTVLRYEQIRTSALDGQPTGAKLVYDYRFERRDGGYLVWVELTEIEGLGEERRARLAETVAAPMLNMRYAIELSPDGEALSIRDEEAVWAATLRGFAHIEAEMRSRPGIGEDERTQMLDMLAAIQAQDGEVRRHGMLIVIADMMTLAGRSVAVGENPHDGAVASPLGGTAPLNGVMFAELAGEDMARVELSGTAMTAERFTIHEQVQYRAAPSSGLVHRMDRSRSVEAPTDSQTRSYSETVSIRLIEQIPAGSQLLSGAN